MKITKEYLRKVIKEELEKTLNEEDEAITMTDAEVEQVFLKTIQSGNSKGIERFQAQAAKLLPGRYVAKNNVQDQTVDIISYQSMQDLYKKDPQGAEAQLPRYAAFRLPYEASNLLVRYGLKVS
jgi:hypothetical protein